MKHYGLTIDLKDDPELIAQYKAHHADPWPEPLQGLREIGITDMKIFLLGTRMFMYMTSTDEFDAERDFPTYVERNPKAAEWDALMRTFQQQVPQAREGEWWAEMEMVFDLERHV
ncbi:MAG: L-rhamnose mutarotase [Candidatus Latescibacterota bacterium]